jgi:hypothetical protein
MMLSTIPIPLLIVLSAVVGLLIGLLVSSFFTRESKPSDENAIPEKYTKEGYAESARLLYSPATKKVITFLDGDYYEEFISLTPEQKKRVIRLIGSWDEWGGTTPKAEEISAPVFESQPVAKTPPPLPVSNEPQKKATLPSNPFESESKAETLEDLGIHVETPVVPVPAVISFRYRQQKPEPEQPKTFVDQINDKLAEILLGKPDEKRDIRLEDNGHQGVIVWVGIEHFDGVDGVPFPEVRDYIKQAVARWENQEPGNK